ncbi:hypothetical protein LSAT2_005972 [Lamellibrachia satsuma]|nr:hypothetical protein LSAT2_005972 [Lamellibrachia satsuma]
MRSIIYLALSVSVLATDGKSVTTDSNSDDPEKRGDCRPQLKEQILTCLLRFEGLLFVYQQPTTSETQRQDMLTDMCRKYEETLQCLHVSLLQCVADEASLQVIASHLGPVRTFMEVTCYIAPRRVTPTLLTTPMTSPSMSDAPTTSMEETHGTTELVEQGRMSTEIRPRDSGDKITTESTTSIVMPTSVAMNIQRVSRATILQHQLTTPDNDAKSDLHTNTKHDLETKQTLTGDDLAMTGSIDCSSSDGHLRCSQQQSSVNAALAMTMCHHALVHLGTLISIIFIRQ